MLVLLLEKVLLLLLRDEKKERLEWVRSRTRPKIGLRVGAETQTMRRKISALAEKGSYSGMEKLGGIWTITPTKRKAHTSPRFDRLRH